jgi:hypothetical protein
MNYGRIKKILVSLALMCVFALPIATSVTSPVYAQGVYSDVAQGRHYGYGYRGYYGHPSYGYRGYGYRGNYGYPYGGYYNRGYYSPYYRHYYRGSYGYPYGGYYHRSPGFRFGFRY